MKRIVGEWVIAAWLLISTTAFGYTKFRYVNYTAVPETGLLSLIATPFDLHAADYTLVDATGSIKTYVHLTPADKKLLMRELSRYDVREHITPEFIRRFKPTVRFRPPTVGLVLQDFRVLNRDATVGSVLHTLGISNKRGTKLR